MSLQLPSCCRCWPLWPEPVSTGWRRATPFSVLQGQMVCSLQFPLVTCLLQMSFEKCEVACWQSSCSRAQLGMYLLKQLILPPSSCFCIIWLMLTMLIYVLNPDECEVLHQLLSSLIWCDSTLAPDLQIWPHKHTHASTSIVARTFHSVTGHFRQNVPLTTTTNPKDPNSNPNLYSILPPTYWNMS